MPTSSAKNLPHRKYRQCCLHLGCKDSSLSMSHECFVAQNASECTKQDTNPWSATAHLAEWDTSKSEDKYTPQVIPYPSLFPSAKHADGTRNTDGDASAWVIWGRMGVAVTKKLPEVMCTKPSDIHCLFKLDVNICHGSAPQTAPPNEYEMYPLQECHSEGATSQCPGECKILRRCLCAK